MHQLKMTEILVWKIDPEWNSPFHLSEQDLRHSNLPNPVAVILFTGF
jgi:hypothetical protein